ncbi:hypothetical protein ABBQ38_007705 [Trebouxia sp. C0009 RCD-2024]
MKANILQAACLVLDLVFNLLKGLRVQRHVRKKGRMTAYRAGNGPMAAPATQLPTLTPIGALITTSSNTL